MIITSVIVTYNRKDMLIKLLEIYEGLATNLDNVIVVNNCSNDGTYELLKKWEDEKSTLSKYIINMSENLGGSGGFYEGIKKALEIDSDWIYVSDDDAFPKNNVFEVFNDYIENNDTTSIAAICGMELSYGSIPLKSRRRINKGMFRIKEVVVEEKEYNDIFDLDCFTYVGTMMNSIHLKKCGITEKDYFIYYDDTEHSLRLSKSGKIICLPEAQIIHNQISTSLKATWKDYYLCRNKILMIRKHFNRYYVVGEYIYQKFRVINRIIGGRLEEAKVLNEAIKDGVYGIKGIHELYKPN